HYYTIQNYHNIYKIPSTTNYFTLSLHDALPISMMGVFNNLVLFDQHQKQNRLDTIIPDLATDWSWSEDGTALTFHLREGVKWHEDRKSTRLNSSHVSISYAVFCLKKKI